MFSGLGTSDAGGVFETLISVKGVDLSGQPLYLLVFYLVSPAPDSNMSTQESVNCATS